MPRPIGKLPPTLAVLLLMALAGGCASNATTAGAAGTPDGGVALVTFRPQAHASKEFWSRWGDGKAELSGYKARIERYGQLRDGYVVLIYVTEPMDRRSWIKDDRAAVPSEHRVNVLKLNQMAKFRTGIYPYSVMTSTFAPVDGIERRERFAPVKIALSVQEWCGHVYQQLRPTATSMRHEIRSYFDSEGEQLETVPAAAGTLYEDALPIQLRELDGPFNDGKPWSGMLVPTLWSARKAHTPSRPVRATIARSEAMRGAQPVVRFELGYAGVKRTFEVEKAAPRRLLAMSDNKGQRWELLKSARLAYWRLHHEGDQSYLSQLGISP